MPEYGEEFKWSSITYKDGKWNFEYYDTYKQMCGRYYCLDVENFPDVQDVSNLLTQEEVNFILNHDMSKEKNAENFDAKFRSTTPWEFPLFYHNYSSQPKYITVREPITGGHIKTAVNYSYDAVCELSNCAWVNIEIFKTNENNEIKAIFGKKYSQNNNGAYIITAHNTYGNNIIVKIEGKNKLIVLMYSEYDKKIREYILEPKPSESIEYITAKQQKTIQ